MKWVEVAKLGVEVAILAVAIYGVCIARQEFQKSTAAFNFSAFAQLNEAYTDISLEYVEAVVASRTLPDDVDSALKVTTLQKMTSLGNFVSLNDYVKQLIGDKIVGEEIAPLLENNHIQQAKRHVCNEICKGRKEQQEWWSGFEDIMNRMYGLDCSCPN